ncbi:MAG: aminoglycoside phosphotransferase family protein [Roseiflexaceae bacterium]
MPTLSTAQLEQIISAALPGERLREQRPLAHGRIAIGLVSGERLDLHTFATPQAATAAVAALRKLRGEIDLPLPLVRASDAQGERIGIPFLISDALAGEPLDQVVGRINDESLYKIGQRLGEISYRVHRLSCPGYGRLHEEEAATSETDYVQQRLDRDLPRAHAAGIIDSSMEEGIRAWFQAEFSSLSSGAALVIGQLHPRSILVRQGSDGWSLSGLLGWEHALGWVPAWDHVCLSDSAREQRYFSLRVGYAHTYDERTPRTHEQVREGILRPYRILWALEQAALSQQRADIEERERHRRVLSALIRLNDRPNNQEG